MTQKVLYFFTFLIYLSIASSFAQVSPKFLNLTNQDSCVLYIGVNNTIEIKGVDKALIEINFGRCVITRESNSRFVLRAHVTGVDTFTVSRKGKILLKKEFRVDRIPEPRIQVAKLVSYEGSVKQILSDPTIYFVIPGCLFIHQVTVWSFRATFVQKNGNVVGLFKSSNSHFTNEQKSMIGELNSGDKILFDSIIVEGRSDSHPRQMSPFTFTIK